MPDDEYAPALDAPSVWTTCPRCGQLTHITAARCPSCGRAAAMPVDPDATQGMDLSLIDPSTGQDRPRAGAAGFRPQHGVQESEREEAARLIAGLASPAAGVPDPPSLFTPVIEPTPGTASLPLPAIGGSDDLSDPADVAGVVPLPETVQLPTGSSPPPPQSPPSSPSPPSPLSSPALPSWAPAATPARAAAAWSSPALTGLRATGRRWLAAASAPRTRPLVVAALAVLAAFIAATAVLVWGQPSRQGATAPASSAPATASLVPVLAAQVTVTASSVQLPDGGITYDPVNLLDGHLETAWNSNGRKDGKGPGMVLRFTFHAPVDLRTITVRNGYQKATKQTGDLFALNARVHAVRVVTDGGSWTWPLADTKDPQTLSTGFGRTSSVRLEVVSIYPGAKYLDLALSEVAFGTTG